jgi:hypothetical protein
MTNKENQMQNSNAKYKRCQITTLTNYKFNRIYQIPNSTNNKFNISKKIKYQISNDRLKRRYQMTGR